jgi:peptidoglycan hydrolase-like protein with peptidoglycan-binding domain
MALPTLRAPNSGPEVAFLQAELESKIGDAWNMAGHDGQGVFGSSTTQAVMEFQRRSGITVDGIVGPETWTAFGMDPEGFLSPEVVVQGENLPSPAAAVADASIPWIALAAIAGGVYWMHKKG